MYLKHIIVSVVVVFVLLLLIRCIDSARSRHAVALHFHGHGNGNNDNAGLWPNVFNVANRATIAANATCGEHGREEFCRLAEHSRGRCGICDANSPDPHKRHSIENAIDGTGKWWQSPTLHMGFQYETITITLDLKQMYQVVYVIVKSGNSPRPGTWILERSLDNRTYLPWQYYVTDDDECMELFGIAATPGKPYYVTDTDVICTSYYSKMYPLENGEIHTSLVNGRPGANETSPELLEFTRARYVQLRLLKHRMTSGNLGPRWLMNSWHQGSLAKRMYYSIRDIAIGGQCVCSGHASNCKHNEQTEQPECECQHNTCGLNCDRCCPLYNQRPWGPGTSRDGHPCEECQCYGHATECVYDEQVDAAGLSVDIAGQRKGGGVCVNCSDFTTGINCDRCAPGYYRPEDHARTLPCIGCACDTIGTNGGECVPTTGACICLPGYSGSRCDSCAPGHRGYPLCEPCPCDLRGTMPQDTCEGQCICKANVEGEKCDTCKPGYFALRADIVEGCISCYCSGITDVCQSAFIEHQTLETLLDWQVSDIAMTQTIRPTLDTDTNWMSIGNYELPGIEAYYWLAPSLYTGNKLTSYGSNVTFLVNWVVMRGDTSGKPTTGPNIILIGANGLRIAYGDANYTDTNATIQATLHEHGWYHVPLGVKDIVTRLRRTEYKGDPVTRIQFLSILQNLKHMLVRAKFHTDQVEGSLEQGVLSMFNSGLVEECTCPTGYAGHSCEQCDYGYVQIRVNTSAHAVQNVCVNCNCNGHSRTCDSNSETCQCEHNAVGLNCERCSVGFYGNPLSGTTTDCKRCACPLLEDGNNFSPSCQLDASDTDDASFVCTQCPKGYTGDHCEICDYGYFGSPTTPGGKCELCSCNAGPCDRTSGQCLSCRGNTEGWRCERCKAHHYGDPMSANCQPCQCDLLGAIGADCDLSAGQCECKERFTGRTCERCKDGYGNVTADCPACSCHPVGAVSNMCDSLSGICDCRPGVEGFRCDACQHLHYGFSDTGCNSCACHPLGSEFSTCDIVTGQCRCKPYVAGRNCDTCEKGYWGLDSGKGCYHCECDAIGSEYGGTCDQKTKQCTCKPGVAGLNCNACLSNYFGFSPTGCKPCDECNKPGHICDLDTGRCVCPPHSRGESCERCAPNCYGLEVEKGCKPCNCATYGSEKKQCDIYTGQCVCKSGYTGVKCDQCSFGYYGYPRCKRCDCDRAGTEPETCNSTGLCSCDDTGQCRCKSNVIGKHCNECSNGTFGLHMDNPGGCTQCFCFGRTAHCTESNLTIGHIRLNTSRELEIEYDYRRPYVTGYEHPLSAYFHLEDGMLVIPGTYDDKLSYQISTQIEKPVYWKLPREFLGDKILSYGGYLRFMTETIGGTTTLPHNKYPLIQLKGNDKIILDHYQLLPSINNRYEIRLHESLWKWRAHPNVLVSRDILMVALQKVQHILIRANNAINFNKVVLHDVALDTAIALPGSPPPLAKGVELCECPSQYNSSSCQNPSIGFYRWYNPELVNGTIVINLIGEAKPCECNGRSNICNIETGHCLNCTANTSGSNCQYCSEGYYGNPTRGKCKPCPCPSHERNFARKCHRLHHGGFSCVCRTGYSGPKCDKCKSGYFGHPEHMDGSCQPCNCNKYGSISDECDAETGQCQCKPGIGGKDCSLCDNPRFVLQYDGCKPCDKCTEWLLNDLDRMSEDLDRIYTKYITYDHIRQLYDKLDEMSNKTVLLQNSLDEYELLQNSLRLHSFDDIERLHDEAKKLKELHIQDKIHEIHSDIVHLKRDFHHLNKNTKHLLEEIQKALDDLENFGKGHIAVKNAVKDGLKTLEEIKRISFIDISLENSKYCNDVFERIHNVQFIYDFDIDDFRLNLHNLKNRLNDMKQLITTSFQNSHQSNEADADLMHRINELRIKIKQLSDVDLESFYKTEEMIKESNHLLNETRENYKKLSDLKQFQMLMNQMADRIAQLRNVSLSDLRKLVNEAKRRAELLQLLAEQYRSSFTISHEADIALKASKAYQDIIDTLNEARNLASNAYKTANEANSILNSDDEPTLLDEISEAVKYSNELRREAEKLKTSINKLKEQKENLNISISDSQNIIWRTGLNDNLLNSNLHNLPINKTDMLAIIHNANGISSKMINIHKDAKIIQDEIKFKLKPELEKLQNANVEVVSLGEEKVSEAERNIKTSKDIMKSLELNLHVRKTNITKWNDTVSRKLDDLKNQIIKAKQTADGLRISLTNLPSGICSRSYNVPNLGPTTTNNIIITIALNNTKLNSSLFHFQSVSGDFMTLQLIGGRIQYMWHLGGSDTGHLDVPLPRHSANGSLYRIEIERIANVAKLVVYNNESDSKPIMRMGSSSPNFTRFDLHSSDKLRIGGKLLQDGLFGRNTGINGCLQEIIFDGKPVGLWNFIGNASECAPCIKSKLAKAKSDTCCYFTGIGYAAIPRDKTKIYKSAHTSIGFEFSTYDEDALLFLAVDLQNSRFVSISLKKGRVQFHIEYGGKSVLILTTDEKYNTGNKTSVSAGRVYNRTVGEIAVLKVNEKIKEGKPMNMPPKNSFPKLTNAKFYIGGVPTDYERIFNGTTNTLHTHGSFLGCIEELYVDDVRYNPYDVRYALEENDFERYSVEPSCLNKNIKIATFEGLGYVQMPMQLFRPGSSFGFVFGTAQSDALLLISFNNESDNQNYYSVSIAAGQIQVLIHVDGKEVKLTSEKTVNDSYYHVLYFIYKQRRKKNVAELRIDDVLIDKKAVDLKDVNISGHVYFGGIPDALNETVKIPETNQFRGTIKDIIFNNNLLSYNELVSFVNVKIGHSNPILYDSEIPSEVSTLMMPIERKIHQIEGCHRIASYSLELGAVKFGDAPHSYVQHLLKNSNFWKKAYTIQLEFRTFYLNGLIFISPSVKKKSYMAMILKQHAIHLIVKGKVEKEIVLRKKYDDGKWHQITMKKQRKKITLTVDGITAHLNGTVPKKLNIANMIYIGGVPENGSHLPETFSSKFHPFRGCIRGLKVNGQKQDLIKDVGYHNNVGQCFPHVEKGSYFAGDAYAIYKYNFVVNTQLELQFEFRTFEQNGILLTIADPKSSHGLSLELFNGAVVMMGNMSNNGPSKVKTNLSTEYSLCDNQWHKVSALYSNEEMTVNVDGVIQSSLARYTRFMESKVESALYIGGMPDNVPVGTLHTRENFKGCIRNILIGGRIMDWTDMDELQNILLNSCPIILS